MKRVALIVGHPDEDKSGVAYAAALRNHDFEVIWMSMDDALSHIRIGDRTLLEVAHEDPWATTFAAHDVVADGPFSRAHIGLLVSNRFSEYGFSVFTAFHGAGAVIPNGLESLQLLLDKWQAGEVLASSRIAMPRSLLVATPEESVRAAKELGYPVVLKQRGGTQGKGVELARSETELLQQCTALDIARQSLIIQQYIECASRDKRMLFIEGEFCAAVARIAKPGEFRSNLSRGGKNQLCDVTEAELELGKSIVAALKCRFVGLDIATVSQVLPGREYLPVGTPFYLEANAMPGISYFPKYCQIDPAVDVVDMMKRQVEVEP